MHMSEPTGTRLDVRLTGLQYLWPGVGGTPNPALGSAWATEEAGPRTEWPAAKNIPPSGGVLEGVPGGSKMGSFWGSPEGPKMADFGGVPGGVPGGRFSALPGGGKSPPRTPRKPPLPVSNANICPDWESY